MEFEYDRYLVDQLIRPIANLYRVTPLVAGESPAGPPIAYVRQKKLAIKEDIRFYADEGETREVFRIKARTWLDTGGSRYDVTNYRIEVQLNPADHTMRAGADVTFTPLEATRSVCWANRGFARAPL